MIGNGIRLSQRKVIRNILTLKVTPRLRCRDLGPGIVETTIERVMGRNPVVGTGTETLTLVVVLLASKVVQPVREEILSLCGDTSEVPTNVSVLFHINAISCHVVSMGSFASPY